MGLMGKIIVGAIVSLFFVSSAFAAAPWITAYFDDQMGLPVSEIPWSKYTHVIMFAGSVDSNGNVINQWLAPSDINPFVSAGHAAGKKVLVCLIDNSAGDPLAWSNSTSPGKIATTVNNIVAFVNNNGFDGVDLDWEGNINTSQYVDLISRLRAAMPTKLITMAAGNWGGLPGVANSSQSNLDQINVMCYDMANDGSGRIWHHAAILQAGDSSVMTCDWRIGALTSAGVAAAKIGVGMPFYGYVWNGGTQPLQAGTLGTSYGYSSIVGNSTWWQPSNKQYDAVHRANYLSVTSTNQFVTYLDAQAIQDYVAWGKNHAFGGFMTFSLHYEYMSSQSGDAKYPLSTELWNDVAGSLPSDTNPPAAPKGLSVR
jgi:chitinase